MLSKTPASLDPALLARFGSIVGEKHAITDPQAQAPYLIELRDLFHGHTPVVLRPGTVAEVAQILRLANETGTPLVPQGGNTGLVGGQTPHHGEVVLSLNRLDRIRELDPVSNTATCEAGVTLLRAREAAAAVDRSYPQLLPSEGPAPSAAIFHQCRRDRGAGVWHCALPCTGSEVVLADGRVLTQP